MKLLIQRVMSARVAVAEQKVAEIDEGLLVLVGFGKQDEAGLLPKAVDKLLNLRIFSDEKGHFQYSVLDQNKGILAVPQFTLYGNTNAGRRPDFISAMAPEPAENMFNQFCQLLQQKKLHQIGFGIFGTDMQVSLVNNGPVTLIIDL